MNKTEDTYKEVKVFHLPKAIVRVHIPDLTDEERIRRHKIVESAAESLLKDMLRSEMKTA